MACLNLGLLGLKSICSVFLLEDTNILYIQKKPVPLTSACADPHHRIKAHLLLHIVPQIVQKPLLVRLGLTHKHVTA